ncbi:MAG: ATP-binding cassette domain-containing protein [Planctomycetota bacterium]
MSDPEKIEARGDLIQVRDLGIGFHHAWILRDISFSIRKGQTLAIIGESGCGKTVLMKTLVGLLRPSAGQVYFDGRLLADMKSDEWVRVRRRFGFVFQNAALFDSMSIYDNVAFPVRQSGPHDKKALHEMICRHVREVGLPPDVLGKMPAELSGGMRKRVGLARALILRPEVLIYDEPTTGLDPIMTDVINELILDTRRRYPVTGVIVTHDMRTVRKVADRVLMLFPRRRLDAPEDPQVLFDGSPADLENAADRRVRQFVRGEAGERLTEMAAGWQ